MIVRHLEAAVVEETHEGGPVADGVTERGAQLAPLVLDLGELGGGPLHESRDVGSQEYLSSRLDLFGWKPLPRAVELENPADSFGWGSAA